MSALGGSGIDGQKKASRIPKWVKDPKTFATVTVMCVIIGLGVWQFLLEEEAKQDRFREAVEGLANGYAVQLARQLRVSVSSTMALSAILQVDEQNMTENNFDDIAQALIETYRGISNLQLAKYGVVTHICPLVDDTQDNTAVIGHALFVDPARRAGAVSAIVAQTAAIIGPVVLLQGGVGLIARLPIFTHFAPEFVPVEPWTKNNVTYTVDCDTNETRYENCYFPGPDYKGMKTHFWGFATMLTLVDVVVKEIHLAALEEGATSIEGVRHYDYHLRAAQPHASLADVGGVFAYSSTAPPSKQLPNPVVVSASIPQYNMEWVLSVAPRDGWPRTSANFWRDLVVLVLVTIGSGVAFMIFVVGGVRQGHLRAFELAKEAKAAKHKRVVESTERATTLFYPMCLIRLEDFMELGELIPHEEAIRRGILLFVDSFDSANRQIPADAHVVFVSHQWLGWSKPDPDRVHYQCSVAAVRELAVQQELELGQMYVWVDYLAVPQANKHTQASAVDSLTGYVALSDSFLVVAPETTHVDSLSRCDYGSYLSRGWCRLEQFARFTASGSYDRIYRTIGLGHVEPVPFKDNTVCDGLLVQEGMFSCCQQNHPFGEDKCDKYRCVDTQLGLYHLLRKKAMRSGIMNHTLLQFVADHRDRIFPKAYFGDLVKILEGQPVDDAGNLLNAVALPACTIISQDAAASTEVGSPFFGGGSAASPVRAIAGFLKLAPEQVVGAAVCAGSPRAPQDEHGDDDGDAEKRGDSFLNADPTGVTASGILLGSEAEMV